MCCVVFWKNGEYLSTKVCRKNRVIVLLSGEKGGGYSKQEKDGEGWCFCFNLFSSVEDVVLIKNLWVLR